MVSFICDTCQCTLKKAKVQAHGSRCGGPFSCIDCSREFNVYTIQSHTSCISEAEKYQGALYRGPSSSAGTAKGKKTPSIVEQIAASKGIPTPVTTPPSIPEESEKTASKKEKKNKKESSSTTSSSPSSPTTTSSKKRKSSDKEEEDELPLTEEKSSSTMIKKTLSHAARKLLSKHKEGMSLTQFLSKLAKKSKSKEDGNSSSRVEDGISVSLVGDQLHLIL